MDENLVAFFEDNKNKQWLPQATDDIRQRFAKFFTGEQHRHLHSSPELFEFFSWIKTESTMTSVRLALNVPHKWMYEEGRRLYDWAVGHRGSDHKGWKSLCVHGLDYDKTNDAYKYGYDDIMQAPYQWTIACAAAPVTAAFFKNAFPWDKFLRVRFMYLEPGGYILPHNDAQQPGMGAINIALNQPEGCGMMIEDKGYIPWKAGDVRFLDVHNRHAVWNNSDELRIHMIAHAMDWGSRADDFMWAVIKGYLETQ